MIGQVSQKTISGNEITQRDDKKKIVSEILKRVDQLIKKGDLNKALAEIANAKEVDSRNVYTLALEERVMTMKANPIPHEVALPVIAPPSPVQTVAAPQYNRASISERMEMYRAALTEAWKKGSLQPVEENQLHELCTVLGLQKNDSERIENEVKTSLQRQASPKESPKTNLVDKKFAASVQPENARPSQPLISTQEQFLSTLQRRKKKETVLVIDDDARLLELLASSLQDSGFEVIALTTSDEAYALLRRFVPDLILCDINLETSTMGGFTFYEKSQELKNIQNVPFIFLTGLTDEALVRTGKELGVDDYLMKPISEATLLSTIRGKLKRFRQLRRTIATPAMAPAC
jgi:CheY-like chemotaxis protein